MPPLISPVSFTSYMRCRGSYIFRTLNISKTKYFTRRRILQEKLSSYRCARSLYWHHLSIAHPFAISISKARTQINFTVLFLPFSSFSTFCNILYHVTVSSYNNHHHHNTRNNFIFIVFIDSFGRCFLVHTLSLAYYGI